MRIIATKDYNDMSKKAANILSAQVIMKPDCVLGLATGSTPIGTYEKLVEWYEKGDLDFSQVTSVNLDEYKGLDRKNDQSYYYFMHEHLFNHVNIKEENTNVPDGTQPDGEKECARYEELIRSLGGVDLQLLGLGHNGHIGFNEPADAFDKTTHCVDLTESTIEANNLTKQQREVLYLKYYKKMSPEEIAQVMGLTSRTVYNTTHMAISSLRERMSKSFLLLVAANLWIFN